jgi:hypothetical protein
LDFEKSETQKSLQVSARVFAEKFIEPEARDL